MTSFSRRQLAQYAVEEILAGQKLTIVAKHLAAAMITAGKQKETEFLISDIDQELEDRGLLTRARLTSAHPLSNRLQHEISVEIKKLTGSKDVALAPQIDKSALGGIRIETPNHAWDKTLIRILNDIKEAV